MSEKIHKIKSYPLRLPPEVRSELEKIAKAHGRSLNTEISIRLKASLLTPDEQFLDKVDLDTPEAMQRLEEIVEKAIQKKSIISLLKEKIHKS